MAARKTAHAKEPKVDPDSVPATQEEQQAVRDGEAKPDNNRPAARPSNAAPTVPAPEEGRVPAADASLAKVVPITPKNRLLKGFREVEVVATRGGYYNEQRQRPGAVFTMGLVGPGYLPSWVKLAKGEDTDPEVAQSRQVTQTSTGQEIRDDARRDSGTVPPTSLGGNERRPDNMR